MKPTTKQAYDLFHNGVIALAEVERVGMRIDVDLLDNNIEKISTKVERLSERLKKDKVWRVWQRCYGRDASLTSRQQLGDVIFGEMDYPSNKRTATGRVSADVDALEQVDIPFVRYYLKLQKLEKLLSTYLKGVRREVVDGYLHPSFNLHFVRTFRSSSSDPNFQNIPVRDDEIAKLIRSCFIPRDGHVLVELDFSALEFRIAACHWKDKAMLDYASNPSLDIHRDMAGDCYLLKLQEVSKKTRFYAKNQCVFPLLYGSYYVSCARNLWNMMVQENLTLEGSDKTIKDHLGDKGISKLGKCNPKWDPEDGTFEKHIMGVEQRFNERFPQWSRRKEKWWEMYQRRGWFEMMTGFRCSGTYSRNDLYNYPVQGPAFHLLLWCLIQVVGWLKKNRMKSKVIGTIHDSIEMDVAEEELETVTQKVNQVMTVDVRKAWPWVIVPLSIECEISRTNWYEKKEYAL
jgi:DNA polymerase-1